MKRPLRLMLALDTATERASLAVGAPERHEDIREHFLAGRRDLSRDIERVAAELLKEAGAAPADLAAIVVADGPGSFTGLRIGIAFAKGMARALGIPLLTAPSLMGAAQSLDRSGEVCAEYDALRGESYRAVYAFTDDAVATVAPPALATGPVKGPRASEADASAAALIELAGMKGGVTEVADVAGWEPAYGRPAEAEARRLAREGGGP